MVTNLMMKMTADDRPLVDQIDESLLLSYHLHSLNCAEVRVNHLP